MLSRTRGFDRKLSNVLSKPLDLDALQAAIEWALGQAR
jgi:hypothetical protein